MKLLQKALLAIATFAIAALPLLAAPPRLVFGSDCTFPPMEMVDAKQADRGLRHRHDPGGRQGRRLRGGGQEHRLGRHLRRPRRRRLRRRALLRHHHRRARPHHGLLQPYLDAGQVHHRPQGPQRPHKSSASSAGSKVGAQIGTTGAIEVGQMQDHQAKKSYDEAGLAVEDLYVGRIDAVVRGLAPPPGTMSCRTTGTRPSSRSSAQPVHR